MKVKIYYTKVVTQEIDVDDKFSILEDGVFGAKANLKQELYDIGWNTVYNNNGDQLLAMKTLKWKGFAGAYSSS